MNVLIVENEHHLGCIWCRHIERTGAICALVKSQSSAIAAFEIQDYDLLILNLDLKDGSAAAIADYAAFRYPRMKIIFVTSTSFFSDGSIFNVMSNACALVPHATRPADLAAMVEYHGRC